MPAFSPACTSCQAQPNVGQQCEQQAPQELWLEKSLQLHGVKGPVGQVLPHLDFCAGC